MKTQIQIRRIFFVLSFFIMSQATAMGRKAPQQSPAPANTPAPNPSPSATPKPTPNPSPTATPIPGPTVMPTPTPTPPEIVDLPFDLYQDLAEPTGAEVDRQYPQNAELNKLRKKDVRFELTDQCHPENDGKNHFIDRIAWAVNLRSYPSVPRISYVSSYFNLSSNEGTYVPTSLLSHSYCRVTRASLEVTYQGKRIPSDAVIAKADRYSQLLNKYRTLALAGDKDALFHSRRLWTKFMGCLGYMESLTTADSKTADQIAREYDFRRPAGVNLSKDPNQSDPASKLAVGIFQLSPSSGGIIQSCLRSWNEYYPQCTLKANANWNLAMEYLGSSLQTFNAFCGITKITDMFGVQVNSRASKNTHPANVLSDGKLKAPKDRCVSPFMNVNTSYNHFGPLQNVMGWTLDQVLTCTLKNE